MHCGIFLFVIYWSSELSLFGGVSGVAWKYRLVLFFVAALVPDLLQLLELIPGTFDVLDIILAFLASAFVWAFSG